MIRACILIGLVCSTIGRLIKMPKIVYFTRLQAQVAQACMFFLLSGNCFYVLVVSQCKFSVNSFYL